MNSKSRRVARVFVISGIVFCVAIVIQAQSRKGRRDAFGSDRASYAEKLLEHVYSGAKVEWDPVLAIRQHSGELVPVDLGNFSTIRRSNGTTDGIALLEIGTDKSEYIKTIRTCTMYRKNISALSAAFLRDKNAGRDPGKKRTCGRVQ
jgi:hypothetical protein